MVHERGENLLVDLAADAEMDFVAELLLKNAQAGFVVFECDRKWAAFGGAESYQAIRENVSSGRCVLSKLMAEILEPSSGPFDAEFSL